MHLTLFLLVGYPGSGKTTAARCIRDLTGAEHIWVDRERHVMFGDPTHLPMESHTLYDRLNTLTDQLLGEGKSVVFDTSFNLYQDRQNLRDVADKHGARTVVVWLVTSKEVAEQRAVHDYTLRNDYSYRLQKVEFDRMSSHLEPPRTDERPIELDGTNITVESVALALAVAGVV